MTPGRIRRRVLAVSLLAPLVVLAGCTDPATPPEPRASDSPAPTSSPTTSAPIVVNQPGTGPLGLKWSWFQPATFDYVRQASGGWTFTEIEWCEVEKVQGQRDWTEVDRIVQDSLDLGHQPMLKLRTGQCWGTQPATVGGRDSTESTQKTPSTLPVDMAAYLDFVTEAVQRYAALGVHEYAVENEVDVVNFWATDVPSYETLVRAVVPAIRTADPQARVLDAGLSSTSYGVVLASDLLTAGDEEGALQTYEAHYGRRQASGVSRWPAVSSVEELQNVLAGEPAQRSIAAEDVSVRLAHDGVVDAYQLHYYEAASALPELLDHLQERIGDSVPIEGWEIGVAWPGDDYDERAHADEVFELVSTLLAHDVRHVVYLPVAYTPGAKTQVFRGLVHEDGTLLPAGQGWIALNDALLGLGDADPTPVDGELTGVSWTADGTSYAIVRATGDPVTLPGGVQRVVDATGAEVPADQPVGEAPVLVTGPLG